MTRLTNERSTSSNKGKQSICDPFWLAKLRAGPLWIRCESASTTNSNPMALGQAPAPGAAPAEGSSGRSADVAASILTVEPDDGVVPEGVTSKGKSSDTAALGEPLSSHTIDVRTGLPRMLRNRAEREDGTPGERYCWEDPAFVDGWEGPPRHCYRDVGNGAHVSKHATSVARMNDGTAGGSARSHNDD